MILRRPYAILIKSFRLIHLILFALLAYITYRANSILSFFKDYISTSGNIEVISSNYISTFLFISFIFVIVLSVVIFLLMRYKKKPKLLYVIIVIVSILSVICFLYLYSNLKELEVSNMSARNIRLLRDISRFNFWGMFIICLPVLVRGLGFDIKKFNFSKDLNELKLEKEDSEEVEINIGFESDNIKKVGRRVLGELKYYYAENKFFINIILIIITLILIISFPFNKFVMNRDLNEKETLGTNYFNIKVTDSFISEKNRISKDYCYFIIKFSIKGKTDKYELKLDNFVLETKENKYIPSLKYYYYFEDVGIGYREQELDTSDYEDYIFIYNIKKEDQEEEFKLNYIIDERKIKLNPTILD